MRFFLLSILVLLTACADLPKPGGKPIPDLHYHHLSKLTANGMSARIMHSYQRQDLNIEPLAIPLPALLDRYLSERFMISDERYGFVVNVAELSATRQLTSEGTFGGLLGGDEQTTVRAVITFTPHNYSGALDKIYTLTAQRRLSINANMSLADRELAEVELLEAFIGDIDRKVLNLFTPKVR
ncbi:MAG: hypothetical protein HRT94_00785 [Alphaproteobacteria bacterium]|nr:hypothetical protein [Alphaproteobacteria bacterium]